MQTDQLKNFPITFYSLVLGFSGFTISLQKAQEVLLIPKAVPMILAHLTALIFVLITAVYLLKLIKYPGEVKKEFEHPIKISFFAAFSISFILLSVVYLPISVIASKYLWYIGIGLHLFVFLVIMGSWMHHEKFKITHMNPAWFIPPVGNILVPVSGVVHASKEISWFFFSVGLILWFILMVILIYRMFFHEALPEKLLPTLFILIAPPAVGVISYFKLTDTFNDFAKLLYYFAFFIALLLLTQVKVFSSIKFYLSWWAYTFPIAAITIATSLMLKVTGIIMFKHIFTGLLIALCLLIGGLIVMTVLAMIQQRICVEEK